MLMACLLLFCATLSAGWALCPLPLWSCGAKSRQSFIAPGGGRSSGFAGAGAMGTCEWSGEGETGLLGIDYVRLYHCEFAEWAILFYPLLFGWGCFLTYLLGHTADAYFSPTLAAISDKLKLTYDVAGVTFLALGNGAPDVFSSIAAFSAKSDDVVLIGICELLGASVFVTTVVVGAVVLLHPAHVQPQAFVRDIVFQILANVLLTVTALYGEVTLTLALGYLFFYAIYVLVVLYLDRMKKAGMRPSFMPEPSGVMSALWFTPNDIVEFDRQVESSTVNRLTHDFLLLEDEGENARRNGENDDDEPLRPHTFGHALISEYFTNPDDDVVDGASLLSRLADRRPAFSHFSTSMTADAFEFPAEAGEEPVQGGKKKRSSFWDNLYWQHWRTRRRLLREFNSSDWQEKTPWQKVVTVLELPLLLLRNWTIPLVEEESWSRATATLYPLCAPLFLMFVTGTTTAKLGSMPAVVLVLLFGALFSLVLHLTTHESHPPTSFGLSFALLSVAFIMCAAWIYTIASELVAVIEAMGVLWHIPSSLLGLTLLAWGNSVGDLITNIAVARAGLSDMAIAGCFAGPTFNLLVGMGLSFLSKAAKVGSFRLVLDERSYISLAFLYLGLLLNLALGYHAAFKLGRPQAFALLGLYVFCTILQVGLLIFGGSGH